MRVFLTGATGFIGSQILPELLAAGHSVLGLTRSEAGAERLRAAGAEAHIGTLEEPDGLRRGAEGADGVIHLAFFGGITGPSLGTRLRIIAGGRPGGIPGRFIAAALKADQQAIEVLGGRLEGSGGALVIAMPTMTMKSGQLATERDAPDPQAPGGPRGRSEVATLAWADRGVRASVVRISPSVHGDGDQGLVPMLITAARKKGTSAYVGDGRNRWPAVHRSDAARLFRLALEKGSAGSRYHAAAEEGVPFREIAEVIGRRANLPVVAKKSTEAADQFGWLAPFTAADNPVSSTLTQEELGWRPTGPGLIADLDRPIYFAG